MLKGKANGVEGLNDPVVQIPMPMRSRSSRIASRSPAYSPHVFDGGSNPGADRLPGTALPFIQRVNMVGGHAQHTDHAAPAVSGRQATWRSSRRPHSVVQIFRSGSSGWINTGSPDLATAPMTLSPMT